MIILDASALLEHLLGTRAGARVSARVSEPGETLHAPHLIDIEVVSGLRRLEARGAVPADRARAALASLRALRLFRCPHAGLMRRMWALRHNLSASDAAYVALAEVLRAPIVTLDAHLARSSGHRVRIELA